MIAWTTTPNKTATKSLTKKTGYPLSSTEVADPVTWKRARRGGSVSPSNAAPCVGIQKRAAMSLGPFGRS